MKLLIAVTLASILTATSTLSLNESNVIPRGRIYNGQKANRFQFPYMVGLNMRTTDTDFTWCGGSLINNKWILTAAHCLSNIFEIQVALGAVDPRHSEKVITVTAFDTFIHENYNPLSGVHDIALIKIPAVEFSSTINSIKLPTGKESDIVGRTTFIAGWGSTSASQHNAVPTLMWGQSKVVSDEECYEVFKENLPRFTICADARKSSICHADSGGPLALQPENILIGVAHAISDEGCDKGSPSIFTAVTPHLYWINRIITFN